jgi:hypothetical protein
MMNWAVYFDTRIRTRYFPDGSQTPYYRFFQSFPVCNNYIFPLPPPFPTPFIVSFTDYELCPVESHGELMWRISTFQGHRRTCTKRDSTLRPKTAPHPVLLLYYSSGVERLDHGLVYCYCCNGVRLCLYGTAAANRAIVHPPDTWMSVEQRWRTEGLFE